MLPTRCVVMGLLKPDIFWAVWLWLPNKLSDKAFFANQPTTDVAMALDVPDIGIGEGEPLAAGHVISGCAGRV